MKNIIWSIVSLSIILLINLGVSTALDAAFIEYAFLTGLGITVIVRFFNSTGGLSSNRVRMQTQMQTRSKVDVEKRTFNPTIAYYTAITYTIIAAIITFLYYKDYFFS